MTNLNCGTGDETMNEDGEEKCFICWRTLPSPRLESLVLLQSPNCSTGRRKEFSKSSSPLKRELAVIFLLRKVLGISSDAITNCLERGQGDNPTGWGIKLCWSCHAVFREVEFVHRRLLKIQADFAELTRELRSLLLASMKEGKGEEKLKNGGGCIRTGNNYRGKRKGRPGRRGEERRVEETQKVPVLSVIEELRDKFFETWSGSNSSEMSTPRVLFTTHGTSTVLDGIFTTQPVQVKMSSNDSQCKCNVTSTFENHESNTTSKKASAVVDHVKDTEKMLQDPAVPNAPIVKREIATDSYGEEHNDIEDFGGALSPDPEWAPDEEHDDLLEEEDESNEPVKFKSKRHRKGISEEENCDSDYRPEAELKPKRKDKRFTRKRPNVKLNMRKRELRELTQASVGKNVEVINAEPVSLEGEDTRRYGCPQEGCEMTFEKKYECHVHVLRDHYEDPMPYHCHVCGTKRFEVETYMRRHMVRYHRNARCPYDEDYDPELHSAEKLKKIVEEDEVWKNYANNKVDERNSENSSDDEGVPVVSGVPDEVLEKFKDDEKTAYICRFSPCQRPFSNEMLRDGHEKRIHQGIERPFECDHCKKPFLRRSRLLAHVAIAHYSNMLSCHHCGSRFADKVLLAGHIGRAHLGDNTPFKCPSCPRKFARRGRMQVHMLKRHDTPLPPKARKRIPASAIPVPKIVPSKAKKILYEGRDLGLMPPKKCWMCHSPDGQPMLFDTLEDLKEHIEKNHTTGEETPFKCPVPNCTKEYRTNGKLDCHIVNFHDGQITEETLGEFSCSVCSERFHQGYLLDAHVRKHGVSMYMCNFCPKQFRLQRYLDDHQRQAHYKELKLDPFKCKECGRIMNTNKSLDHHIRMVHTKDTPFKCSVPGCNFGTMYTSMLKSHMDIKHSDKKNAICPICSRTFAAQFYLNNHMRVHTGEKPYKCPTCDKLFSDMSTFKRHKEAHLGKIHRCPLANCGKEYVTRHAYRIHLKQHQKKGDPVEVPNYRNIHVQSDEETSDLKNETSVLVTRGSEELPVLAVEKYSNTEETCDDPLGGDPPPPTLHDQVCENEFNASGEYIDLCKFK